MFDYTSLVDELVTGKSLEYEMAQRKLDELRDKGAINLGQNDAMLHSSEMANMLAALRGEAVTHLRSAFEELEFIDSLMLLGRLRTTHDTATLDEVITTLAQSGIEMKPSHWAVVCMLCDECGKPLTPQQLVNALKHNKLASKKPLPSRQAIINAYIPYSKKAHFPNWPRNSKKEQHFYELATHIKPLIDVMA